MTETIDPFDNLSAEEGNIAFRLYGETVLEFRPNGDILVQGRLIENDLEVLTALRQFIGMAKVREAEPQRYYIRDVTRGQGFMAFWRTNAQGYTRDIDRALLVTKDEASLLKMQEWDVLIPEEEVLELARRTVCVDEIELGKSDLFV